MNLNEKLRLRVLRHLASEPRLNQRGLAIQLGLSLGKANYCLRALAERGLIKISNFRRSDNKLAYAYLLTPSGLQEKALLTIAFLKHKQKEYENLQVEIAELEAEVVALEPNTSAPASLDENRRSH